MPRFVVYYRVSTRRQGQSGLGLEAQRMAVRAYLGQLGGPTRVLAEHEEIESGCRSDRPALDTALAEAWLYLVPVLVAKVDRLTRSVAFLSRLMEANVDVRFCDLPQIEGPTGRFLLQQMAAVAELEAGMISARTKAALAAAKAGGKKLGGRPENLKNGAAGSAAGVATRQRRAQERARDLAPVIATLRREGALSLGQLAVGLTARGIPAARGGPWSAMQVARVLAHAKA